MRTGSFILVLVGLLSACAHSRSPVDHSKFSKLPLNTQLYHRGPYGSAKFLRAEFKIPDKKNSNGRYIGRLFEAYESSGPWANFVDVYDLNNAGKRICSVRVGGSDLSENLVNQICFRNQWIPPPYRKGSPKKFVSQFLKHFTVNESGCFVKEIPDEAGNCWSVGKTSDWEYWLN